MLNNHVSIGKYFINHRYIPEETKFQAFYGAIEYDAMNAIKFLVENGIDIHIDEESFLNHAIRDNIVKYLIRQGADYTYATITKPAMLYLYLSR